MSVIQINGPTRHVLVIGEAFHNFFVRCSVPQCAEVAEDVRFDFLATVDGALDVI